MHAVTPDNPDLDYVSPELEVNLGLWFLWAGAALLLGVRVYLKITRHAGLWYDDYILLVSLLVLTTNDSLIVYQYAHGYVNRTWDDRMHILINITSSGGPIGQTWTKTAFGVTLLRIMNRRWQRAILWFCIITMNTWMVLKVLFQWVKVCDRSDYQQWYRLNFCIYYRFRQDFKEAGNIYNIMMDFVFALFPWILTWSLNMQRKEKIALCATLSLGMLVAVESAARTDWKDRKNPHDRYYYYRNGLSAIWYSSETAGTIIVQCVPILRPLIREIHTSLTSKKLDDTSIELGDKAAWQRSQDRLGGLGNSTLVTSGLDRTSDEVIGNGKVHVKTHIKSASEEVLVVGDASK